MLVGSCRSALGAATPITFWFLPPSSGPPDEGVFVSGRGALCQRRSHRLERFPNQKPPHQSFGQRRGQAAPKGRQFLPLQVAFVNPVLGEEVELAAQLGSREAALPLVGFELRAEQSSP